MLDLLYSEVHKQRIRVAVERGGRDGCEETREAAVETVGAPREGEMLGRGSAAGDGGVEVYQHCNEQGEMSVDFSCSNCKNSLQRNL